MASASIERQAFYRLRVLIADDHPIIRKHIRSILEEHPRFEVCGEAHDGAIAIKEATRLQPDVIVLNVNMPVLNGFDAAKEISSRLPKAAIVILSVNADRHFIEEAKRNGARAYVSKSRAGEELVNSIGRAVIGEEFVLVN
jgi:two-component system nitrate/nitrite response regulator NarL